MRTGGGRWCRWSGARGGDWGRWSCLTGLQLAAYFPGQLRPPHITGKCTDTHIVTSFRSVVRSSSEWRRSGTVRGWTCREGSTLNNDQVCWRKRISLWLVHWRWLAHILAASSAVLRYPFFHGLQTLQWPRLCVISPFCHCGRPVSFKCHCAYYLWWKNFTHGNRLFSVYFGRSLSVSFQPCSTLNSSITDAIQSVSRL